MYQHKFEVKNEVRFWQKDIIVLLLYREFGKNLHYFEWNLPVIDIFPISGPVGSPYEGGIFFLYLKVPFSYPFNPPEVRFLTRIFHPNVSRHGDIGIDSIQQHNWVSGLTIPKVQIICLFHHMSTTNPEFRIYQFYLWCILKKCFFWYV